MNTKLTRSTRGVFVLLFFTWASMGCLWAMDVVVTASIGSCALQGGWTDMALMKGMPIDGLLFYHTFMYLMILIILLLPFMLMMWF